MVLKGPNTSSYRAFFLLPALRQGLSSAEEGESASMPANEQPPGMIYLLRLTKCNSALLLEFAD
jgi:hypothetical protein